MAASALVAGTLLAVPGLGGHAAASQDRLPGPVGHPAGTVRTTAATSSVAAGTTTATHAGVLASVHQPRVNCAVKKCVALTFDDGPGPMTPTLMRELDAAHVKATFFEIGRNVQRDPGITRALVRDGMVVGNHTWDHPQLNHLSASAQRAEVGRTAAAIVAAGAPRPTLLRPPYGSFNHATRTLGESLVLWNVDSEDWRNHSVSVSTANVLRETRRGSNILMHDIQPSTIRAVPGIIRALEARGYTFVTVPQLLGGTPSAGTVHFSR